MEMYFDPPKGEDEIVKFGGRRDKKDEHDNLAGQPREVQRDKNKRANENRRVSKVHTLKTNRATNQDGNKKSR